MIKKSVLRTKRQKTNLPWRERCYLNCFPYTTKRYALINESEWSRNTSRTLDKWKDRIFNCYTLCLLILPNPHFVCHWGAPPLLQIAKIIFAHVACYQGCEY